MGNQGLGGLGLRKCTECARRFDGLPCRRSVLRPNASDGHYTKFTRWPDIAAQSSTRVYFFPFAEAALIYLRADRSVDLLQMDSLGPTRDYKHCGLDRQRPFDAGLPIYKKLPV